MITVCSFKVWKELASKLSISKYACAFFPFEEDPKLSMTEDVLLCTDPYTIGRVCGVEFNPYTLEKNYTVRPLFRGPGHFVSPFQLTTDETSKFADFVKNNFFTKEEKTKGRTKRKNIPSKIKGGAPRC